MATSTAPNRPARPHLPACVAGGNATAELWAYARQAEAYMDYLDDAMARLLVQFKELRHDVAQLKNVSPPPKFPEPPSMDRATRRAAAKAQRKARKAKNACLRVNEVVVLQPAEPVPPGSRYKGCARVFVQDLVIGVRNIEYRRARYVTPEGVTLTGELPAGCEGRYGPTLGVYIRYQYHACRVTQPVLLTQLRAWGVDISSGQLNALLTSQAFDAEAAGVLEQGLLTSPALTVDDTGAPHQGRSGSTLTVSGPYFAAFKSTTSKSRDNFLTVLHGSTLVYKLNAVALKQAAAWGLPAPQVLKLKSFLGAQTLVEVKQALLDAGITGIADGQVVVQSALAGGLEGKVHPQQCIVSDGAGQFNLGRHGRCWIHAERLVRKLTAGTADRLALQKQAQTSIWGLYRSLHRYKARPTRRHAAAIRARFKEVFTAVTGWSPLDELMRRLNSASSELLLVLARPDVPLHTNQSEGDIRGFVTKRKVSGGTRSEDGRTARDTFATLCKTAVRLSVNFWNYLVDRQVGQGAIPLLGSLVAQRSSALTPALGF